MKLTYTKRAISKASAFRAAFNVDLDGIPFALLSNYTIRQGGGWYVGFADVGFANALGSGTFSNKAEAVEYIEALAVL